MEEKKKFEKPEVQVVELKHTLLDSASSCGLDWCAAFSMNKHYQD